MSKRLTAVGFVALALAGCAARPQEFAREPQMTPVGAGLTPDIAPHRFASAPLPPPAFNSLYQDGASLYRDPRAMKPGDPVTITIAINDKATLGNTTTRSLDSEIANQLGVGFSINNKFNLASNLTSSSKSGIDGQGTVDRSEKIQLSVAAIVTEVLPDGNLVVSGSQELRVNYEIRQLLVAGIVRPRDISKDNTISYEKIAEARISYGGRGRLSEVQQPGWGQQLYDNFKPN